MRRDLRLIVLIREDLKVLPLQRQHFLLSYLRPLGLVRPELNSRPPAWQPNAQPTELSVHDMDKSQNALQTHFLKGAKTITSTQRENGNQHKRYH